MKVPLGDMHIIGTAFEKVAIDLVGPLVMSDRKHRWVLTMKDFATRYPIPIPMTSFETVDVAEALVGIFAGVRIPREILSDRGSQFTSDLMKEITRLLSIKQLTTTPYHAMCNGLVEKFNGTLKLMLKRMTHERPGDWDRYIPALLFAYREVPQEISNFHHLSCYIGGQFVDPCQFYGNYGQVRSPMMRREQHTSMSWNYVSVWKRSVDWHTRN